MVKHPSRHHRDHAPFINRSERDVAIHRPFGERGNFGFLPGEAREFFDETESRIAIKD